MNGATTLSITTFSTTTLSIKGIFETHSINGIQDNGTQHNYIQRNDTQHKGQIWDTQHKRHSAWHSAWQPECHPADCHYAECRDLFIVMLNVVVLSVVMLNVIMLNVIMLNVIMLNVVMLSVVMLSVVAPKWTYLCRTNQGGKGKCSSDCCCVTVTGSFANNLHQCKWSTIKLFRVVIIKQFF
jgi:hypothetical protein